MNPSIPSPETVIPKYSQEVNSVNQHLHHSCGDTDCSTQGCQLWFKLRPGFVHRPGAGAPGATATADDRGLLRLCARAFALPLALFVLMIVLMSSWGHTTAHDGWALAGLIAAGFCGWYAMRRQAE